MLEQLQTNLNKIDDGVFNPGAYLCRYPPTGANGLRKRYVGNAILPKEADYVEVDETDQPASRDERRRWPSAGDEYTFLNNRVVAHAFKKAYTRVYTNVFHNKHEYC